MALSGSKDFELDVADYVEEAFERCGLELRTGYDLKSATRSLNLMLAEWANRGLNQWTVQEKTLDMVKDTATYNIDSTNATAPIDVLDVFIRETVGTETTDLPLTRLSRAEYAHITTKSSTYVVHMNVLTRMDDADAGANTLDMPFRFYPCLAAGLAYYISLKRAPDRTGLLKGLYEEEFQRAMSTDEDRASFNITPNLRSYNNA